MVTIAFYNLENLFDTIDDPTTLDDDFTPKGEKRWTNNRYKKKVFKLTKTISEIGTHNTDEPPVLVGIAEVENENVVKDLVGNSNLENINYEYVHYDSPDERGIDTALIYNKDYFTVLYSEPIHVHIINTNGEVDNTRDILYVHGILNDEEVHVFVNHWPSKREGKISTDYKRIEAAKVLISYMAKIEEKYPNPNYIIMGDFNDSPKSDSIKTLMDTNKFYNPSEHLLTFEKGSASYKRKWSLFDQIIISHSFLNYEKGTHSFLEANIFDEHFLTEFDGKFKGTPFRTYVGRKYVGGYSDHFPVFIQLKYNE